jgi:hypothetical protein
VERLELDEWVIALPFVITVNHRRYDECWWDYLDRAEATGEATLDRESRQGR